MPPLLYDRGSWRSTLEVKSLSLNASLTIWQGLMKVNTGSEITVLECLPYYMREAHEGQHWKWNHCPWMTLLLYERGSWRSTMEVKLLSLNASPTIWLRLMKVNTGSEITVLECLPYYMTEAHEGQHWKWNYCPWIPPLLYERGSWRSTLEVKSLSMNVSPTIWQWLMKVNIGSEISVLECLPYYMKETHDGQHWNWNHCTWMPPLLYNRDSWRSKLEVKSLSLNASPTIWQGLMKVNTGGEISVLECLPYYMTDTHEGKLLKWNHCPWMPPLLYDSGSWRSTLEVKSLSLNASPSILQGPMKVNTGREITDLECLPYYMIVAHEGQNWKWNHCPWMPPLQLDMDSWKSTLEVKSLSLNASPSNRQRLMKVNTGSKITVLEYFLSYMREAHKGQHWKWNHCPWMSPLLYDSGSWRSTQKVKSLSMNVSPTIWQWLMKVNTGSEIYVLECLPYYMTETHDGQHWNWNHCPSMRPYYITETHEGQNWKWNHCPWMPPLLYDKDSWKSTLEVKSLYLNASPTIWQILMKVNSWSEITVLECLPYYMIVAHEGQHWKWNHWPWMPPLLYDSCSWRSKLEVKSLSLNASPTVRHGLMKVNTGSEISVLECLPF